MKFMGIFTAVSVIIAASQVKATTYFIDRAFDGATVVGSVETDGTLGVLETSNIVDFYLEVNAPNLDGGNPDAFSPANGSRLGISGGNTTATSSGLFFNFDEFGVFFLDRSNFWCLQGTGTNCGSRLVGEVVGRAFNPSGPLASQIARTGTIQFATTQNVQPIPLPLSAWLLAAGISAIGLVVRRRT